MSNYKTGAQRYNDKMNKIFARAEKLKKIDEAYENLISEMRSDFLQTRFDDENFKINYNETDEDFNEWLGNVWQEDEVINELHNKMQVNFSIADEDYIMDKWESTFENLRLE